MRALIRFLAALVVVLEGATALAEPLETVDFQRSVMPLLAKKCFACHGPDSEARPTAFRLDSRTAAFARLSEGSHAIVPGKPDASDLYRRITATDDAVRMPPPDAPRLSEAERSLLRRWIAQGAPWDVHWAFQTPRHATAADPSDRTLATWARNPIDRFALARMQSKGLKPSPEATRAELVRRVTLDLTGLPPTPAEVDAFCGDRRADAYERLVDRLLHSPRYGERMAVDWLDAARYADTHGYLYDTERSMWPWRNWVIEAYNRNLAFDQFTIQQLAGDLMPDANLSTRIASGFHRNHIINNEAGAIPEEYFAENVIDRVNTTATVWLGLTLGCCQCHDHKYDPLTQLDYYRLYAFFNNVPELGLDGLNRNARPWIKAPTSENRARLQTLRDRAAAARDRLASLEAEIQQGQAAWAATFQADDVPAPSSHRELVGHWPLDGRPTDRLDVDDATVVEAAAASYEAGVLRGSANLDGLAYLNAGDRFNWRRDKSFSFAIWIRPTTNKGRLTVVSRMEEAEHLFRGYALQLVEGFPAFFLVETFPDSMIQVQSKVALEPERWHHLAVTYDGSSHAAGVKLYVDGTVQPPGLTVDSLQGPIATERPFWIGNGQPAAKFKGQLDDLRVYRRVLSQDEVAELPGLSIRSLLASNARPWTEEQGRRIRHYYLEQAAPSKWREAYRAELEGRQELEQHQKTVPTTMVMEELKQQRETRILQGGAYDQQGEPVSAGTPELLLPMHDKLPRNRLGLAQWLTDPRHPLTARVTVNRYWQMYFGTGLVETSEDFGVRGALPSHPELLDWLAVEFVRNDWDIKALQRLIVTSATYRQSSRRSADRMANDPANRWLARGPGLRLSAEMLRDQALAASGLLVEQVGGPSVKPYQPPGLWREVAFDFSGANLTAQIYETDSGAGLYRRSLYTFWKRTAPPPSLLLFDAPDRERCVVRRQLTNTPLQALTLMNDPTYVEAARRLAETSMRQAKPSSPERIQLIFRRVIGRKPDRDELRLLSQLLERQRTRFSNDLPAARRLLHVGASIPDDSLEAHELAALTIVASLVLNLDEAISKR